MKVLAVILLALVFSNAQTDNPCSAFCNQPRSRLYSSQANVILPVEVIIPPGREIVVLHTKDTFAGLPENVVTVIADGTEITNIALISISPGLGNITVLATKEEAASIRAAKSLTLEFDQK